MQTTWTKASICMLVAIFLLFLALPASAGTVPLEEWDLYQDGSAASIYAGDDGTLYVVDKEFELWKVNPQNGNYLDYLLTGGTNLADIALAPGDTLWWADNSTNFGSLDLTTNQINSWPVVIEQFGGEDLNLGPVAFYDGKAWLASWYGPTYGIFSYDETNLCLYQFPAGLYAADLVAHQGLLWVLDWSDKIFDYLFSLDPASGQLTAYPLGVDIQPNAQFQVDGDYIWWAEDRPGGALVRFNPQTGASTTFNLPAGSHPRNLTIRDGSVWYTDIGGSFGRLDPALAASQTGTLTSVPFGSVESSQCVQPVTSDPWPVEPILGTIEWEDSSGTVDNTHTGLQVYNLPDMPGIPEITSAAYGIAGSADAIWVTDFGRQKLVRMPLTIEQRVFIPLVLR